MHLVLDLPLAFFVCFAMGYAQLKDSTMTNKSILAMLDAQKNPTPSHYNECPRLYDLLLFILETGCSASTERPSYS